MSLSESMIAGLVAGPAPYKKADGEGLYLLVRTNGSKAWQMAYRFDGKQKTLSFGAHGDVSLKAARLRRNEAKAMLAAGVDPTTLVKAANAEKAGLLVPKGERFVDVAEAWFARDKTMSSRVNARSEKAQRVQVGYLIKELGDKSIRDITRKDMIAALRVIEATGSLYVMGRCRAFAEHIFLFAEEPFDLSRNFAPKDLLRSLAEIPESVNHPAMPFKDLPKFYAQLRAPRKQGPDDTRTRLALELILHTVLRSKELRHGRFSQIEGNDWHLPAKQMKKVRGKQFDHIVPLTARALEIIDQLRTMNPGSDLMFPIKNNRHGHVMWDATLSGWMDDKGWSGIAVPHGFRGTFSTYANEQNDRWNYDWIEMQLAHTHADRSRSAYNKARYLEKRREMLNWWAGVLAKQEQAGLKAARRVGVPADLHEIIG